MTHALEIFQTLFSNPRDPRSPAYKAGVLDALKFRLDGARIRCPYATGSAESDAFHAGLAEGHAAARRVQSDWAAGGVRA